MPDDPSPHQPELTGQVAVVTGGGRGLGRAFAEALAGAGATVALAARSAAQLAEVVAAIGRAGGHALAIPTDIADAGAVERMVATVEQQLGPVDLLINNAAITTPVGPVCEVDADAWWRCMEANLRGPFLCSRMVVPRMIARRRGRIVNVASTAGLRAIAGHSAYGTSKAALIRLTEILAAETQRHGLAVFAINPGLVRTTMTEHLADSVEGRQWMPWVGATLAAGRDVPVRAVVDLVLYLASGRADVLSGRFLNVSDDVAGLVARHSEIVHGDFYTMRLNVPPT